MSSFLRRWRQAAWIRHRRRIARNLPEAERSPLDRFLLDGYQEVLEGGLELTPQSVVVDVGAYRGDFVSAVRRRYDARVFAVEPVPAFVAELTRRFASDDRVVILPYAIAAESGSGIIFLDSDATGLLARGVETPISFASVAEFGSDIPEYVSLMMINIEGAEYDLVPILAKAGVLERVEKLYIQFHQVGEDYVTKRERCREVLSATHSCLWDYDFVWECWSRNREVGSGP